MATSELFLFSPPTLRPELSQAAKAAITMSALASQLVVIERTRIEHPGGRAENDAEHSLMLAKVAPELAVMLYPELDEHLVARFATLHDDVEAYVGDTPTDILANLDPKAKEQLEANGLRQLTQDFANMPSYVKLIKQYEEQIIPEAQFVRAVDKLMVLVAHFPNQAVVLQKHYTYQQFLDNEAVILKRDSYKYGSFEAIKKLRQEIGRELAE